MILKLVLPESDRTDALLVEKFCHLAVALTVAFDLGRPEFTVGRGYVPASAATMPEATVHEDGQMSRGKEKIRFSRQICSLAGPTADPCPYQSHLETNFGSLVAFTAYGCHRA